MMSGRSRVILAGYSPDLPDLTCVRALDRAIAAGLIIASPDLPRDLGNRSTYWLDDDCPIESSDELWEQVQEILERGQSVLRWYPDNPLATTVGQSDADNLSEAGIPLELVPVVPSEIISTTYAGVRMPAAPRTLAESDDSSTNDFWASQNPEAVDVATLTITLPGTPDQSSSVAMTGEFSTHLGGEGAKRRLQPNWFESLPLFGKRILVTRTISQAPVLSRALQELGAEPVELPAIDIIPNPFPEQTQQAVEELPNYDWVIFTSTNGVEVFLDIVRQSGYDARRFGDSRIAAIGNATAERLRRNFIEPNFVPDEFVAEAVLDGLRAIGVEGKRVLIPRAEVARTTLPEGLRESGSLVDVVPVYRTVPGTPDPSIIDRIDAGEIDIVTFTSSSTVTNLVDMLDGDASRLRSTNIACIGPITEATARDYGLGVSITASEYSIPGLIDALCTAQEGADDDE
jgi:uroporphyrinogen-III synthase